MQDQFVQWFRHSSPYIHAHRGTTVVIAISGDAVLRKDFHHHIHDFALLNSLGIRLVLVYGIRPQINQRLTEKHIQPKFHNGLRITDKAALECVKEAAGHVRVELEALFTTSLGNSPMAGARIRVVSGNVVIAKPYGVHNGVDFEYTGQVRRIDSDAINQALAQNSIVLISPIGYSVTGEVYNLSSESVATEVAISLNAEKLILMTEQNLYWPDSEALIKQMTTNEANEFIKTHPDHLDAAQLKHLSAAIQASSNGVQRVHLLNHTVDGAILQELFSRDGIGTLISSAMFEELRVANLNDIPGIIELIHPLEQQGILSPRTRDMLETSINDYLVLDRDGHIVGCAAAHSYIETGVIELACLAIHPDYRKGKRAQRLIDHIVEHAQHNAMKRIVILTTQTSDWFREQGFVPGTIEDLPPQRQAEFNANRNSRVLYKQLVS
ncbi:MAG: amino-acid N-acetyltransferase [Gammaproteobacteria bacterium]|nr:amino-acid N-acetyltransferase [Gammaproteobacteria bacterium]